MSGKDCTSVFYNQVRFSSCAGRQTSRLPISGKRLASRSVRFSLVSTCISSSRAKPIHLITPRNSRCYGCPVAKGLQQVGSRSSKENHEQQQSSLSSQMVLSRRIRSFARLIMPIVNADQDVIRKLVMAELRPVLERVMMRSVSKYLTPCSP